MEPAQPGTASSGPFSPPRVSLLGAVSLALEGCAPPLNDIGASLVAAEIVLLEQAVNAMHAYV